MPKKTQPRQLADYAAKRDFTQSPEPRGRPAAAAKKTKGASFCVQKHLASHLHYDFRLEHNGVLLSWAVPKGPSLNPADKRMAVQVEDHPVDYGDFEGVIPSGYGAGIVLLWDKGTWAAEAASSDIDAALKKGELKFQLKGVKLKGSWVLVRSKRRQAAGPEQWLLIKHRDPWAGEVDVAAELPQSVKSFGDLSDILAESGPPLEWTKSPPVKGGDAGKLLAEVMKIAAEPAANQEPPVAQAVPVPKLTNRDKVLYPDGTTKGDLMDYYKRIAPLILPQLAGRAVTLKRFPDGVEGKSFFEKRCAAHRPDWLKTYRVARSDKNESIDYCALSDVPALMWAGNMAAIELHVPLALARDPDRPTAMVFDLDPGPPARTADCVPVALKLKALLDHLGLKSLVKTSGGKGLHLLVPLNAPDATFDQTKSFARAVAMALEKDDPRRVISSMTRSARAGKVFIDWSQNDRNKTTVCVFSVRANKTPTVSWPISWADLKRATPVSPTLSTAKLETAKLKKILTVLETVQSLPTAAAIEGGR